MRSALSGEAVIFRGPLIEKLSDEEFFQFCQDNRDLRFERTANHEIVYMSPAGFLSSECSGEILRQLSNWNIRTRLGRVGDSSAAFTLPDGATLSPDVSWLSLATWARVPADQRHKFLPVCPEFVVEVKSPSDRLLTLQDKMQQWVRNGVQLGFLIDPEAETVYVYRSNQAAPEMTQGFAGATLSGEPLLPSFMLELQPLHDLL